ncbi:hypothetical protein ACVWYN_003190 [Pedobacter sp. UYP24]
MKKLIYLLVFISTSIYAQVKHILPFDLQRIARITGKSLPGEQLPNPSRTDELYNVGGTDLGIAWDMENGKTGFFFGDTYGKRWLLTKRGGPGAAGDWRSNVLGISGDKILSDGIKFDKIFSQEIIPSPHQTDGKGSHTSIPTSAIHANELDYVHFMDIKKWGKAGNWFTNYSGLFKSADHGVSWYPIKELKFSESSKFAQVAYAKKDCYVYMIGTHAGRSGPAYLARVKEQDIEHLELYEFYNKVMGWCKGNELFADEIISGPVGEASLLYHTKFKRWIITYLNEDKSALVLRDTEKITNDWSYEKILVSGKEYPALYGAFIYPLTDSDELYFMMSMWQPYNVFLMRTRLKFEELN